LSSSINASNNRQRRKKKTISKVTRTKSKTPANCAMHRSSYRLLDSSDATLSDNAQQNGDFGNLTARFPILAATFSPDAVLRPRSLRHTRGLSSKDSLTMLFRAAVWFTVRNDIQS
jgi:hypothetical protein